MKLGGRRFAGWLLLTSSSAKADNSATILRAKDYVLVVQDVAVSVTVVPLISLYLSLSLSLYLSFGSPCFCRRLFLSSYWFNVFL